MDKYLSQLLEESTPKMNRDIVDGLAVKYIPYTENYLDSVFRSASESFPEGLVYIGCERCSPHEEFIETTRPRNNKRTMDIAKSDLYLMKYFFRYKGVDLPPRYLYLPFVGEAGTIYLGGSRFLISPVLTDKVISPGPNNVFVRLLRDKVTFERTMHSMVVNGVRDHVQVIWSGIYRKSKESKKVVATTKANTTLAHYLFAKYGFFQVFEKYAGFRPVLGEEEINDINHPKDKWVIVSSSQVKPRTFIGEFYKPSSIRVAIPIEHWNTLTQSLLAGFFYTVDHFPTRLTAKNIDNVSLWKILLGHIIFSGLYGEGRLHESIQEHFSSLDDYVDNLVVMKLEEEGYRCSNFYDLLVIVLQNFNQWVIAGTDQINSMYGKELSILYHVLFEITSAIFRMSFRLSKLATKKELTEKEIIETMNKNIRAGLIYSITRSHVNLSTVNYSGDNKFFKMTCMVVPQAATNKMVRQKKSRGNTNDPSKKLHVSIAEAGGYLNLPKSNPAGNARINPFVKIDARGTIIQDPNKKEMLERTEALMKGQIQK